MSRRWGVRLLGLAMILAWVPGVFAQSQATTGVIEGIVTDEGGGVLPGASVVLRNTATNFEKTVVSGGRWKLPRAAAAAGSLSHHS